MAASIRTISGFIVILLLQGCHNGQQKNHADDQVITLTKLLQEMTDRESMTRFPEFSHRQLTSWDRTQKGPEDPETWFNNADYGYYIRKESRNGKEEYVIMDEQGPGCIVRIEIPLEYTYRQRIVRIYLDGQENPEIEENYHDLISGNSFAKWPFAFISSDERDSSRQYSLPVGHPKQMGANFFLPVPFAKSCKVTLDDNPFYYTINYRIYKPGARIESFSLKGFQRAQKQITLAAKKLTEPEEFTYNYKKNQTIPPGGSLEMVLPAGSNAIRSIRLKFDNEPDREILRTCVLKILFDNSELTWCPVSEFFGGGVYLRPARNFVNMVSEDGVLQSNWVMPYRHGAQIQLVNYGSKTVAAEFNVATLPYAWGSNSMYFHANWHEDAPINTSRPIDWNYINIKGQGVYAGDILTVHAFSKGWWGEGDEKIYLDGEKFPSILGTGLEDYYGYSWGMAHQFSSPFISLPMRDARGKTDWSGYTTVTRLRLLDGIPFNTALDVNVEAWLNDSTVTYSNATFWYSMPGAKSDRKPEEASIKRLLPDYQPQKTDELPGIPYPDPALNGQTIPEGNGSVKHAGNQIDLLEWRSSAVKKTTDADRDDIYGTSGYYLINARRFDARAIKFIEDSVKSLPNYIGSLKLFGKRHSEMLDTWLIDPKQPDIKLITGATLVECVAGQEYMILQIRIGRQVPGAFRLGIMTDNLNDFSHTGDGIRVRTSGGGDSGLVPLARSNRFPDWYFFDLTGINPGEMITVSCFCKKIPPSQAGIGGLTFDSLKK